MNRYPKEKEIYQLLGMEKVELIKLIGNDLEYVEGSFKIKRELYKKIAEERLSFCKSKLLDKDNKQYYLPMGCELMLSSKIFEKNKSRPKFSEHITPVGWDKNLNKAQGDTYIHRGHIIAYELFEDEDWKVDKERKYFTQTEWSNISSHTGSLGRNQSFYENYIKSKLIEDTDLVVNYRVNLIYKKNDIIPRGMHLRAVFMKKSETYRVVDQFNVFVPNVDLRLNIDYKNAKFEVIK
ncbi:competence protein [Streptococcus sp. sy004]|uniref:competence protein n=1 Tax=Streptococcus sp. sy004 TaxID=2600149 RepID=UPI0011B47131|nr:competence protein [Streptococcus sp. sy004]TWT11973.1 competence protein [Streptococcus sp. sy004]